MRAGSVGLKPWRQDGAAPMPARRVARTRPTSKRLASRRRATPKQPRKVRRRMAARATPKAAGKAAKTKASPAPKPKKAARKAPAQPAAPATGKLRIALFGAGGTVGSRIASEAAARGHLVTPIQRTAGFVKIGRARVGTRRGDATDAASVADVAKGHDAVVSAVAPPPERPDLLVRAARGLVAGCRAAAVPRLVIVNGAGSLLVPAPDPHRGPDQIMLLDSAEFPRDWRPTAIGHRDALEYLRDAAAGLQWTAISPPALIAPGVRTGRYQIGTDRLLRGRDGQSRISAEDYAVAVVDELEKGRFKGKRMTVAWP